jgi:hypothetical protein
MIELSAVNLEVPARRTGNLVSGPAIFECYVGNASFSSIWEWDIGGFGDKLAIFD